MKRHPWKTSVLALSILFFCVLGCKKSEREVTNTNAANNNATEEHSGGESSEIAGNYRVTGTNENGSPYRGDLEVIKQGDVYQFSWQAGNQYDGIGVTNGNVVAVAFTGGANGTGCGVVNYRVVSDQKLDGKWGYWGSNQAGTEQATRTSGSGFDGEYNTTGTNPNSGAYKGTLSMKSTAGGYTFNWSNGSTGFGVKQGNNISVGVGGPRCGFVAYEIRSDGTLDGIWGGYGSSNTGTEKATKK